MSELVKINQDVSETNLQIFDCDLGSIRVVIDNNEPLFNAYDLCSILEYKNGRDTIARLFGEGVAKYYTLTKGGKQLLTYLSEAQVYKLIMRSKAKNAEAFQDWVCNEVIPSLRKNGGYIVGQEAMTPEQIVANALIVANNIIKERDKTIAEQKQVIEFQGDRLDSYKEIEKSRRSKAQLKARFNKYVRLLAEQSLNKDYPKAYRYVYDIFRAKHNFSGDDKIDMKFLNKNIDYLQECLEIVLSEIK